MAISLVLIHLLLLCYCPTLVFVSLTLAPITNVEPKKTLHFTLEPKSIAYFQFKMQKFDEGCLLHVLATPGSDKLVLYLSNENMYPSAENFKWSTQYTLNPEFLAIDSELSPFTLNEVNMLEYDDNCEIPKKPIINYESTAIKIDEHLWKYTKKLCYIGIFNKSNEEVESSLTVNEYKEVNLLPKGVLEKYLGFNELFKEVDGRVISQSERNEKKIVGSQYIYGEIELVHFLLLLKIACNKVKGVFWDLGSGTGKALIAASLSNMSFSKICGVEILEGLYNTSITIINKYCENTKTGQDKFKLVNGDMKEVDWSDGDVVYIASICFSDDLIRDIAEKGKALKSGAKIISLKKWPTTEVYNLLYDLKIKMSWGNTSVYIMERL